MAIIKYPHVERNGKVAVIYSSNYGAGWSSWNPRYPKLLFDPNIVQMIEDNKRELIKPYVEENYGEGVYISTKTLQIEWLPVGTRFRIKEYDGAESIIDVDKELVFVAGMSGEETND